MCLPAISSTVKQKAGKSIHRFERAQGLLGQLKRVDIPNGAEAVGRFCWCDSSHGIRRPGRSHSATRSFLSAAPNHRWEGFHGDNWVWNWGAVIMAADSRARSAWGCTLCDRQTCRRRQC